MTWRVSAVQCFNLVLVLQSCRSMVPKPPITCNTHCLQQFLTLQPLETYQFQLSLIEGFQQILWNELVEPFLKSEELLLNAVHEPETDCINPDVPCGECTDL